MARLGLLETITCSSHAKETAPALVLCVQRRVVTTGIGIKAIAFAPQHSPPWEPTAHDLKSNILSCLLTVMYKKVRDSCVTCEPKFFPRTACHVGPNLRSKVSLTWATASFSVLHSASAFFAVSRAKSWWIGVQGGQNLRVLDSIALCPACACACVPASREACRILSCRNP